MAGQKEVTDFDKNITSIKVTERKIIDCHNSKPAGQGHCASLMIGHLKSFQGLTRRVSEKICGHRGILLHILWAFLELDLI